MDRERELRQRQAEREQAVNYGTQASAPSMQAGALGCYDTAKSPYRLTTRDRIERTLREAQSTYERAAAAQRAKEIIDAHPEFAELLDALNAMGG